MRVEKETKAVADGVHILMSTLCDSITEAELDTMVEVGGQFLIKPNEREEFCAKLYNLIREYLA